MDQDKNECTDVNECSTFGRCSQLCANTKGGFECGCLSDYNLVGNTSCVAKDDSGYLIFSAKSQVSAKPWKSQAMESALYQLW